jgi:hypothetical protein
MLITWLAVCVVMFVSAFARGRDEAAPPSA